MIARRAAAATLALALFAAAAPAQSLVGHDGKFFLADDPGDHRLNFSGQLQVRYQATFRDSDPAVIGADNDVTTGFVIRRTKIKLDGTDKTERLSYKLTGAFARGSGRFVLEDALVAFKITDDWTLSVGQFKGPLLREELVSSTAQMLVERSIVNETFNQGFMQGAQIAWDSDRVRFAAMVSDGLGSANTTYNAAAEADFGIGGRVEVLLGDAGDWKRFKDFTSWRGSSFNAMLGAAVHFQSAGETNPSAASGMNADVDALTLTADASLEGDGWNAFASFVWRRTDAAMMPTFDDLGASVQGGVFVSADAELFARWDAVFADSARMLTGDELHTIAAGVNYYFLPESHAAKLTANVLWYIDPASDLAGVVGLTDSVPILADAQGDQVALVIQLQLLF